MRTTWCSQDTAIFRCKCWRQTLMNLVTCCNPCHRVPITLWRWQCYASWGRPRFASHTWWPVWYGYNVTSRKVWLLHIVSININRFIFCTFCYPRSVFFRQSWLTRMCAFKCFALMQSWKPSFAMAQVCTRSRSPFTSRQLPRNRADWKAVSCHAHTSCSERHVKLEPN